ncbi:MAG: sugar transferase [Pseudomonadota bacterium]|nr:sugar transferase [Pseudomonadota bacterium]
MIKRLFDLIAGIFILILSSPFLLLISILNALFYDGNIFFTQERIGINGKTFKLYKFKSMNDKKDEDGILLDDTQRVTSFGAFLRDYSLDEIPSVINLILGDISLVGPRPLPEKYRNRFSKEQFKRHNVKPGITGLAQVKGRNTISWRKKFQYDLFYVQKNNFLFDLIILINTFKVVVQKKGINHNDKETMPEFYGSMKKEEIKNEKK